MYNHADIPRMYMHLYGRVYMTLNMHIRCFDKYAYMLGHICMHSESLQVAARSANSLLIQHACPSFAIHCLLSTLVYRDPHINGF